MIRYLFFSIFMVIGSCTFGQEPGCIVKLPAISGSYTGGCKKGLANGKGIAQGVDRYEGQFVSGLPEGKGIYRWADGSYYDGEWKKGIREGMGKMVKGDSVIIGFWNANKYQGRRKPLSYSIKSNRYVARYTFSKTIEHGNGVKIRIMLGGSVNSEIEDFSLGYNSGTEYKNLPVYGIENCSTPMDVTVRYRTWNQLHTIQFDVVFEFTIYEPGVWNVTIINM